MAPVHPLNFPIYRDAVTTTAQPADLDRWELALGLIASLGAVIGVHVDAARNTWKSRREDQETLDKLGDALWHVAALSHATEVDPMIDRLDAFTVTEVHEGIRVALGGIHRELNELALTYLLAVIDTHAREHGSTVAGVAALNLAKLTTQAARDTVRHMSTKTVGATA